MILRTRSYGLSSAQEFYRKGTFLSKHARDILQSTLSIWKLDSHCSFQETAYHRSLDVRKNFIYNIPAMLQMLDNKELIKGIFIKMFKDPNKEIKLKCVACFSEVRRLNLSCN